jgi:hypothetical protein
MCCPREEARTKSLGYSSMNLDAFSVIGRVAEMNGVDLWRFRTEQDIGVEKAFDYLMPYLLRPETWKKEQIADYSPGGYIFPVLAGLGLHAAELLTGYRKLPHMQTAWVQWIAEREYASVRAAPSGEKTACCAWRLAGAQRTCGLLCRPRFVLPI